MKIVKVIIIIVIVIFFLIGFIKSIINSATCSKEDTNTVSITTSLAENSTPITNNQIKTEAPIQFIVLDYNQDYLGGNYVQTSITNLTNQTITGVQYTLAFYNFKGELLYDTIRGWSAMSWTTDNIKPGESIYVNGGAFYNPQFTGRYSVIKIEIGYANGEIETIKKEDFNKYEQICFSSDEVYVWINDLGASFHRETCEYRDLNNCDTKVTITEAYDLGKKHCQFCFE